MRDIDNLIDKVVEGKSPAKVLEAEVLLFKKPKITDFKVGQEIVQPDTHGDYTVKAKVKSITGNLITTDKGGQYTPDELRLLK